MTATARAAHLLSAQKTNPLTWWLAGLSLAVVASLTGNVFVLIGICVTSLLTIRLCRDESPWAQSISFYIKLAAIVISLRVLFRIIFKMNRTEIYTNIIVFRSQKAPMAVLFRCRLFIKTILKTRKKLRLI